MNFLKKGTYLKLESFEQKKVGQFMHNNMYRYFFCTATITFFQPKLLFLDQFYDQHFTTAFQIQMQ